ncbi:hypothetical protein [Maridesulfovibrio sp.]|uniref:hypothetical protein n=1 Tax=Maridesulfovibrio sp. TaxID=2795000 RepID=UPI0029F53D28|nr:hypothetical protein [Maridesulfovibrio sp.]
MKKILPAVILLVSFSFPVAAQDIDHLKNLKRPRYEINLSAPKELQPPQEKQPKETKHNEITLDNSRFCGTFKGYVTVHYKGKLVRTPATMSISFTDGNESSHFNSYLIPKDKDYFENTWEFEQYEVNRSVTITGNTLYVTDTIAYRTGGNSQIRTLVFNRDCSALTFLKTEFDDEHFNPATGHIIGRFVRVK